MDAVLYEKGKIISMDSSIQGDALLVRDGRIAAVGRGEDFDSLAGVQRVSLNGACLLPGFIDAHSHVTAYAQTMLLCSLEGADSFEEIARRLKDFQKKSPAGKEKWIVAFGYDQNFLTEQRHPDRRFLDGVIPDRPVMLSHASGHMGVVNSAGLARLGLTGASQDPAGGRLGREPDGELTGYLEETAFTQCSRVLDKPSPEEGVRALRAAQREYLSYGVTTVQDGITRDEEWSLLTEAMRRDALLMDTVSYADMKLCRHIVEENGSMLGHYNHRLKLGGYKIFLDGSPQGRTAWMRDPYLGDEKDYRGYPVYQDQEVQSFLEAALKENIQVLAHCNGDAAAQQFIDCYLKARKQTGLSPDLRPVMIHAQLVRPDQLARMKELGMIASFFTAHTYYWGDVHMKNFGPERARAISPAMSAQKLGVPYTFHQDTPVIAPNMLETIRCAVTRKSKTGQDMGREECVSPMDALRAVTSTAAYQYFEENEKGTLSPGKAADLVILDRDPTQVPREAIGEIRVMSALVRGKPAFVRES